MVFMAAALAPAAAPAFEGSLNLPVSHVTKLPPHFVVSFMQHVEASVAAQVAVAQFNAAALLCFFIPAAQECVELEHLAWAVQQLDFMAAILAPAALFAFAGSLNMPASQEMLLVPHFAVPVPESAMESNKAHKFANRAKKSAMNTEPRSSLHEEVF